MPSRSTATSFPFWDTVAPFWLSRRNSTVHGAPTCCVRNGNREAAWESDFVHEAKQRRGTARIRAAILGFILFFGQTNRTTGGGDNDFVRCQIDCPAILAVALHPRCDCWPENAFLYGSGRPFGSDIRPAICLDDFELYRIAYASDGRSRNLIGWLRHERYTNYVFPGMQFKPARIN